VDTGDVLLNGDVLSPARERRRATIVAGLEMLALAVIVYGPTAVAVATGRPMVWAVALGGLGGTIIIMWPSVVADCLGPAVRITET
jgi:hypothetical protein